MWWYILLWSREVRTVSYSRLSKYPWLNFCHARSHKFHSLVLKLRPTLQILSIVEFYGKGGLKGLVVNWKFEMELVDTEQIFKSIIDLKILVFPIVFKIVSNEFILWVFFIIKSCQLSNFFDISILFSCGYLNWSMLMH